MSHLLVNTPSASPEEEAIYLAGAAAVLAAISKCEPAALPAVLEEMRQEIAAKAQEWLPSCLGVGGAMT